MLKFVLLISGKAVYSIPTTVSAHYGNTTLRLLRQLERKQKKLLKHENDIEFLKLCLHHRVRPKMTNFKLYKNDSYVNKIKLSTQMKLMAAEINYHLRQIKKIKDDIKQ